MVPFRVIGSKKEMLLETMCFLGLVPFGSEKKSSHAHKAGFCYFGVLFKISDKFPCAFLWECTPPATELQLPPLSIYMYIYPSCESFIMTCKDMNCFISVYQNCYPLVVRNLMMVILSWEKSLLHFLLHFLFEIARREMFKVVF